MRKRYPLKRDSAKPLMAFTSMTRNRMSAQNLSSSNSFTPNPTFVVGPGAASSDFVDRRESGRKANSGERRQFGSSHSGLSEAGLELALAIDKYKLEHHRRYITCDEMLAVINSLGYERKS